MMDCQPLFNVTSGVRIQDALLARDFCIERAIEVMKIISGIRKKLSAYISLKINKVGGIAMGGCILVCKCLDTGYVEVTASILIITTSLQRS